MALVPTGSAATANVAGVPLLTLNVGDFKLIDDLVEVVGP
jgi:predicted nucleic acid-binding protein